jgi:LDH2 family malate/lactate/ureidoglycolate dehydrogenase
VAPPGGIEPRISTNPIAIGVPTPDGPLVLDISTSTVANGKLKIARLAKARVPWGWIQDAQGNATTDPEVMLADPPGMLLPFGGDQSYKGFGLGLMFDILAAGLAGGWCPPAAPGTKEWNNVLLLVWDPRGFAGAEHFAREARKLTQAVRNTRTKPSVDRIRLPGDRSRETRAQRLSGGIPLADGYLEPLLQVARKLAVPPPQAMAATA